MANEKMAPRLIFHQSRSYSGQITIPSFYSGFYNIRIQRLYYLKLVSATTTHCFFSIISIGWESKVKALTMLFSGWSIPVIKMATFPLCPLVVSSPFATDLVSLSLPLKKVP